MTATQSKVITGEVRFSYVHVFTPDSIEGQEPKYSAALLIPKTDKATMTSIGTILRALKTQALAQYGGRLPQKFAENPVHDGDVEKSDSPEYQGMWYINAKARNKPGCVKQTPSGLVDITDEDEFYSGCYGRASISFYLYDKAGQRGIGVGLNNVLKTRDGDYLGGRASAKSDFAEFDTNSAAADFMTPAGQGTLGQVTYPQQVDAAPSDDLPF